MENFIKWLLNLFKPMEQPIDNATGQTIITTPIEVPVVPVEQSLPVTAPTISIPSKLDLWCKAAIEMEGANPANNNPGNIRYVADTWMQKLATGERNGFCVFPNYEVGYHVLQQFFINAATGRSQIYHPLDTLYDFYSKYAPASDNNNPTHYAQFVAGIIGVSASEQIKNLV